MFNNIKKALYFTQSSLLHKEGLINKKIVPFDDKFYDQMRHIYFNGIPISIHIKYLNSLLVGRCYERSLLMFFCFSDSLLCRGDQKDLEFQYGKEKSGHGWIEIGDYVYDPSLLMRFDKELYYKIYKPTNINKCTLSEYCSTPDNQELYDDVTKTTIYDLQTPSIKRMHLIMSIPAVKAIAEKSCNEDFINELNAHLAMINYDEREISKELSLAISKKHKYI